MVSGEQHNTCKEISSAWCNRSPFTIHSSDLLSESLQNIPSVFHYLSIIYPDRSSADKIYKAGASLEFTLVFRSLAPCMEIITTDWNVRKLTACDIHTGMCSCLFNYLTIPWHAMKVFISVNPIYPYTKSVFLNIFQFLIGAVSSFFILWISFLCNRRKFILRCWY